jgi:hypothetical protein
MTQEQSQEAILSQLLRLSQERWGADRTAAIRTELEQAARHLQAVTQNLPHRETEPGFYQQTP